jgi:hypothetical protein
MRISTVTSVLILASAAVRVGASAAPDAAPAPIAKRLGELMKQESRDTIFQIGIQAEGCGLEVACQDVFAGETVARISMKNEGGRYHLYVSGRLGMADLRRLEDVCGPALVHKTIPLDVHLYKTVSLDPSARAFLERLQARGASLLFGLRASDVGDTRPPHDIS